MGLRRRARALIGVTVAAGVLSVAGVAAAGSDHGVGSATSSVSSGEWGASASPTVLTFTSSGSQDATVSNTGTITLVSITYKVTISNPSKGSPTFTLFVCPVAWSAGKCQGGSGTAIGGTYLNGSQTTVTSTVVPAVGGSVYLQGTGSGVNSSTTMAFSLTVSSATQVRAGVGTNQ